MRKYTIELIGTFFLVLTIALTAGDSVLAPIAIGSILMVMVYMGGHVSGAHYNPAITLGVVIRGAMKAKEAGAYMVAQLLGAVLAGWTASVAIGEGFAAPAVAESATMGQAFLMETLFTFALVSVVLHVATSKSTEGNSYFGLAIGFTVLAGAFAAGGISGAAFNPAVGIGPNLVKGMTGDMALYLIAPFLGGILAALVYKFTNPND